MFWVFFFCLQVVITLSLSYMVGTIASFHNTVAVVITMAVTLAITFAIIAFSAQVRWPHSAAFVSYMSVCLTDMSDIVCLLYVYLYNCKFV